MLTQTSLVKLFLSVFSRHHAGACAVSNWFRPLIAQDAKNEGDAENFYWHTSLKTTAFACAARVK